MEIRITKDSKIEKTDKGILVDGRMVLLKDFLIAVLMCFQKLSREEAIKAYEKGNPVELLIFVSGKLGRKQ